MFKNGDMYVGEYKNGKFFGKGKLRTIQVSIRGQIILDIMEISLTEQGKVLGLGRRTIWTLRVTNTRVITKTIRRLGLVSTFGRTGLLTRDIL